MQKDRKKLNNARSCDVANTYFEGLKQYLTSLNCWKL